MSIIYEALKETQAKRTLLRVPEKTVKPDFNNIFKTKTKKGRVVGYLRVSTDQMETEKRKGKGDWILLIGGTEKKRKETAQKLMYENWVKIRKELTPQQIIIRNNNIPPTVDVAEYDDTMLRNLLLGEIEGVDISVNSNFWLYQTEGRLLNLYLINGLVLHNINYEKHSNTLKLMVGELQMIKATIERMPSKPYGRFIIALANYNDFKKIDQLFAGMFLKHDLTDKKNVKGDLKEGKKDTYISDEELKPFLIAILKDNKEKSLTWLANKAESEVEKNHKNWIRTIKRGKKKGKIVYGYSKRAYRTFFKNLKTKNKLR